TVTASAAQLYWTDDSGIHRANTDGSGQQLIVSGPTSGIWGIAADTTANKLYWIEGTIPAEIRQSNLDGSNPQHFLTVGYAGGGIFVHPTTHAVWWGGRRNDQLDPNTAVLYTSPDGSATASAFMPNKPDLNGFFIDASAGKLYNIDTDDDGLTRYNLDGTGFEGLSNSTNLAIDFAAGKFYFTDSNGVYRANLNNTGKELAFTPPFEIQDQTLAFDPVSSTLFMDAGTQFNLPGIYRANTDGTGLVRVIPVTGNAGQLILVQAVPEQSTLAMLLAALPLGYLNRRRWRW